jgi:hypothetical protein
MTAVAAPSGAGVLYTTLPMQYTMLVTPQQYRTTLYRRVLAATCTKLREPMELVSLAKRTGL